MPPFRSVLFCAALTSLFMATGAAVADMSLTTQEGVLTPSLAPIVATVAPGVVSISVSSQQSVDNPVFTDPFFRQFFDFLPEGIPRDLFVQASGSGVVVDATEGLILTNAHLLENAETITVRLADGREYPAEIRGVDQDTDVAALMIEASNLTALTIGHSGDLRVGDYVLAVGNPFGLEGTVTLGIVSALGRSGLGIEGYENFIQVDAAINPGNSGGGLVNLRGELVGINTAIAGPTGGNVGIGFAIPIDMAMQVASQLVADGRVDRGQIGITLQDMRPELAKAFGFVGRGGVLITEVLPGSPAEIAGLAPGDIIASIDGEDIADSAALRLVVGMKRPGTDVMIGFQRDGRQQEVRVTLRSIGGADQQSDRSEDLRDMSALLDGAALVAVPNGAGRDGNQGGVLIESLAANSPLGAAGLRPGDVIISANGRDVSTPQALDDIAKDASGALVVRVYRMGHAFFAIVGG